MRGLSIFLVYGLVLAATASANEDRASVISEPFRRLTWYERAEVLQRIPGARIVRRKILSEWDRALRASGVEGRDRREALRDLDLAFWSVAAGVPVFPDFPSLEQYLEDRAAIVDRAMQRLETLLASPEGEAAEIIRTRREVLIASLQSVIAEGTKIRGIQSRGIFLLRLFSYGAWMPLLVRLTSELPVPESLSLFILGRLAVAGITIAGAEATSRLLVRTSETSRASEVDEEGEWIQRLTRLEESVSGSPGVVHTRLELRKLCQRILTGN